MENLFKGVSTSYYLVFNVRPDHDNSALPLRWFHFEKVVEALVEEGKTWMKLDKLSTVIKRVCHIEDQEVLRTMLNFYHDLGVIVKHGHTVVLQAQWLIDLFKQLITVPPFEEVVSKSYCFIIELVFRCCGTTIQKLLKQMFFATPGHTLIILCLYPRAR